MAARHRTIIHGQAIFVYRGIAIVVLLSGYFIKRLNAFERSFI
jgi:hypothetical protein